MGEHSCGWSEFVTHFGINEHRMQLLHRMESALQLFRAAGCRRVFIGGSFVCAKEKPGDFEGCFDDEGMDEDLFFRLQQAVQHEHFGGKFARAWEKFETPAVNERTGVPCAQYYQRDRRKGYDKGIVVLDLETLPPPQAGSLACEAIENEASIRESLQDELDAER